MILCFCIFSIFARIFKTMQLFKNIVFFVFTFFFFTLHAQQDSDYISVGTTINFSQKHNLLISGGYSPTDHIHMTRVEPAFRINNNISLILGYIYRNHFKQNLSDQQITIAGNFKIPLSNEWQLSSRSMYAYRFRQEKDDTSFLRQRLGITYKTEILDANIDFHLYDELFFSIDNHNFDRNQISLAGDFKFLWLTPQLGYTYQMNKDISSKHIFTLSFIVPLENFDIFQ